MRQPNAARSKALIKMFPVSRAHVSGGKQKARTRTESSKIVRKTKLSPHDGLDTEYHPQNPLFPFFSQLHLSNKSSTNAKLAKQKQSSRINFQQTLQIIVMKARKLFNIFSRSQRIARAGKTGVDSKVCYEKVICAEIHDP